MYRASCLCGDVTWQFTSAPRFMLHCHCGRCRKAHGTGFVTFVGNTPQDFRLAGAEQVAVFKAESAYDRAFCARCGSVVPSREGAAVVSPAGSFVDDLATRPQAHLFVTSRAPWVAIRDALPRHDASRDDRPALPDRPPLDPPGRPRGSCLCGAVAYVVEGQPIGARNCHCGRCRRARSAAHASNLFVAADGLRFTRGAGHLTTYRVPEAQFFSQVFCRTCGAKMPRIDHVRGLAVIPMGGLDDDPGLRPQAHIFVADKAPWFDIPDDGLPRFAASAPPAAG